MKKQMAKNGKMTLDKLAGMTQRGFAEMNHRFEKIDEHFEKIDERFEKIDERFETVDQRFKGIDSRFDEIDARFQNMDNKIDALHFELKEIKSILPPIFKTMSQFDVEVINLRQRMSRVEKKVGITK